MSRWTIVDRPHCREPGYTPPASDGVPADLGVLCCDARTVRSVGREEALEMLSGFAPGRYVGDRSDDLLVAFSRQDLAACAACLRDTVEAMDDWEFPSVMPLEVREAETAATDMEALAEHGPPGDPSPLWRLDLVRARYLDWSTVAASADGEPGHEESWFRVSVRECRWLFAAVRNATHRDPALMSSDVAPHVADLAVREALDRAMTDIESHAAQMSYRSTPARGVSVEASLEISTGHATWQAERRLRKLFPQPRQDPVPTKASGGRAGRLPWSWSRRRLKERSDDPIKVSWSVTDLGAGSLVRLDLRCTDRDYLARKPISQVFALCEDLQEAARSTLRQP